MQTIITGNYEFIVENLDVNKFRNGNIIPEIKSNEDWIKAGKECKPAWCYYDNDSENGKKFGKLYNWYAVNDPRKLAPKDWHIPAYGEYTALIKEMDKNSNSLKAIGQDDISTNSSGFSGLLAGFRGENAEFCRIGIRAAFWCSTEHDKESAYVMSLFFEEFDIKLTDEFKEYGFSVRCIKESASHKVSDVLFKNHRLGD
ncbi:MAG: fibrobacter succinogenes major paralogous domain-containing protein [Ignavibacteriaceae bacterium]|nr:fibrobacter succinogenes major paralogous domain-containing protein [Ignavibacteriaceae bacterium]